MFITLHLSSVLDTALRQQYLGVATTNQSATLASSVQSFDAAAKPTKVHGETWPQASTLELEKLISRHGLTPEPLFAKPIEAMFSGIWHVRVPEHDAERIVADFLRISGVEAAYSKAEDALPEPPMPPV